MDKVRAKAALYDQFARIGAAFANGHRVSLLDILAQGPRTVEALARECQMSMALTSAHLKVLRGAGLVLGRRDGQRVMYSLASADVYRLLAQIRYTAHHRLAEAERAVKAYLSVPDAHEPVPRAELWRRLQSGEALLIDVRPADEFLAGHIVGAISIPLDELPGRLAELPAERELVAYCRGPYCVLASEAVALLERHGHLARRLEDGFPEWQLASMPVSVGSA